MMFKSVLVIFSFLSLIFCNCPNGSVEWNSHCYFFQKNSTAFPLAVIACQEMNGNLASVHDAFTNALLASEGLKLLQLNDQSDFWIGGNALMNAGNWSWIDNSTFDFADWSKGEPQNVTGAGCASITTSTGLWSAQDCMKAKPFVCDVSATPTLSPYISCPFGWAFFEPTQSCYGQDDIAHAKKTWEEAEELCESQGAHLTSIHSVEEYNFIEAFDIYAYEGAIWTGLRSDDGGLTWTWTDKTPYDFVYWSTVYPNNTMSGCATSSIFKFVVEDCTVENFYMCKKSAIITN